MLRVRTLKEKPKIVTVSYFHVWKSNSKNLELPTLYPVKSRNQKVNMKKTQYSFMQTFKNKEKLQNHQLLKSPTNGIRSCDSSFINGSRFPESLLPRKTQYLFSPPKSDKKPLPQPQPLKSPMFRTMLHKSQSVQNYFNLDELKHKRSFSIKPIDPISPVNKPEINFYDIFDQDF